MRQDRLHWRPWLPSTGNMYCVAYWGRPPPRSVSFRPAAAPQRVGTMVRISVLADALVSRVGGEG